LRLDRYSRANLHCDRNENTNKRKVDNCERGEFGSSGQTLIQEMDQWPEKVCEQERYYKYEERLPDEIDCPDKQKYQQYSPGIAGDACIETKHDTIIAMD
jgi:hypothetical protein